MMCACSFTGSKGTTSMNNGANHSSTHIFGMPIFIICIVLCLVLLVAVFCLFVCWYFGLVLLHSSGCELKRLVISTQRLLQALTHSSWTVWIFWSICLSWRSARSNSTALWTKRPYPHLALRGPWAHDVQSSRPIWPSKQEAECR